MKQYPYSILCTSLFLFSPAAQGENKICCWVYTKEFSADELHAQGSTQETIVEKGRVSPFTQLILSWNAYRPIHGHYTFWVQGRDVQTGAWSSWHKMMSWGPSLQCSYLSDADTIAQHHHVRFEACTGKKMNGFRVKVTAHNGANLHTLHALTIAYADLTNFTPEDATSYNALPSVRIKKVPKRSQFALQHPEKHRLCSPTSCAILVEYFSRERCNMHSLAHAVFDAGLDTYGSWPFNMAHAFELCQGTHWWRVVRLNSFKQLHAMLEYNYPVAVSVRGSLRGAPKSYDNGHLMVVIGYDAATHMVICHDPACAYDKGTIRKYALDDFLRAWEKSHRLAYCAYERKQ
jgi:hypothetical protein